MRHRLKLPVDEAAYRTGSVFFRSFQQTGPGGMRLVVGIRLALKISRHPRAACGRVNGLDTGGKRLGSRVPAKLQDLSTLKQKFYRPAKSRPELHLTGNGTLHDFTCDAGIENEGVGELNWLAHKPRVA